MSETFNFYGSYIYYRVLSEVAGIWPLVVVSIAAWNLFSTQESATFSIIVLSILTPAMIGVFLVARNENKKFGPEHCFYEITVTPEILACKNKQHSVDIRIKDIKKIKVGRSFLVVYYGEQDIYIPDVGSGKSKKLFALIKQTRPELEISQMFPFSFKKY